jgi:DNA polymerase
LGWQLATIGPPASRSEAPQDDALEAGWDAYYQSVFNPARVNPKAMRAEMPKKYWANMPETRAIPKLIRSASGQTEGILAKAATLPVKRMPAKSPAAIEGDVTTLEELNRIISAAEPLVKGGTRAVCGEGPVEAAIAFVGEQPGDQEDLAGRPFVGPAGQLFDRALADAGIVRTRSYLTNAVKHFKFVQRGKHRLHQKPTAGEIKHYRWWLMKELEIVRPRLIVALGGSAALALSGKAVSVTRARGAVQFADSDGYVTVHPSYLLRLPDEDARRRGYEEFVADLREVRRIVSRKARKS